MNVMFNVLFYDIKDFYEELCYSFCFECCCCYDVSMIGRIGYFYGVFFY